jgi:hypothetical protein
MSRRKTGSFSDFVKKPFAGAKLVFHFESALAPADNALYGKNQHTVSRQLFFLSV